MIKFIKKKLIDALWCWLFHKSSHEVVDFQAIGAVCQHCKKCDRGWS